jgi:hypothetical protein
MSSKIFINHFESILNEKPNCKKNSVEDFGTSSFESLSQTGIVELQSVYF